MHEVTAIRLASSLNSKYTGWCFKAVRRSLDNSEVNQYKKYRLHESRALGFSQKDFDAYCDRSDKAEDAQGIDRSEVAVVYGPFLPSQKEERTFWVVTAVNSDGKRFDLLTSDSEPAWLRSAKY